VEGLPERLTRLSGVTIDQVHPIHFDENGGGEDFFRFMEELKRFMMSEWYHAISKEVEQVLAGYSATISALVLNKLNLEERPFYNFMKDTPVDFSGLAGELLNKVNECLELHFDIDQHQQFATRVGAHCLENIQAQLQQDLQPDKSVMLFFDKRVNEKELRKATKNCRKYSSRWGVSSRR
jgi:hypothetical protein